MTSNEKDAVNKLIKRIQLLEIENEKLRKENDILKKNSEPSINVKEKYLGSSNSFNKILPIFNGKQKGCTCKGNCASKICGCKKKNLSCNETCKCNAVNCKNKEKDKENVKVNRSPKVTRERIKSLPNCLEKQNVNTSNNINNSELIGKKSHQTLHTNSNDDVFEESINSNLENFPPQFDVAKKLLFFSDDDTPNINAKKSNKNIKTKSKDKNEMSNVNLRSRHIEKSSKNNKTINEIITANHSEKIEKSLNIESIKSTGVTSCIKSVSNFKQPKSLNSESLNYHDNELSRITRDKQNNGNSSQDIKNSKLSSSKKGNLLRRSLSSEAICVKQHRSRSTSRESLIKDEDRRRTKNFNRSLSHENLSKRQSISKISHNIRRSKSTDNANYSQRCALTPVIESPQVSASLNNSNEKLDKSLKFDPMQPTYQLSRSPIPAIEISAETSETCVNNSPPIFRRFSNSENLQIFSPPPEILQDLNAEAVDPSEFQSKLINCRKCKRSFFPHRIKLHEAICRKK
ncbi:putative uncharacterized protein DDB_G0282133 [Leptopilina boulardi]|uniref:putative uncharacterized protein DDB_G0282133 n=1 Tax=Leptopilina boulardi TaxID=63433 RepID=UPI0021F68B1D|nr:putative uncharacterized protein DDB_G0282133 [Leptopilina boulardi]